MTFCSRTIRSLETRDSMAVNQPPEGSAARLRLVSNALWLVSVSVLRRPVRHCLGGRRAAGPPPVAALASGSRSGASDVILIAAGVFLVVLAPLACAKRGLGRARRARACTVTAPSAASERRPACPPSPPSRCPASWGWRQADRAAALIAAAKAPRWRCGRHGRRRYHRYCHDGDLPGPGPAPRRQTRS